MNNTPQFNECTVTVTRHNKYGQSIINRVGVDPAFAPLIAAGIYAEDALANGIVAASEARLKCKPLTQAQANAWDRLRDVYGQEIFSIEFPAAAEIAINGMLALMHEVDKMLTHPAVRDAYEQFLMVVELTKNESREHADKKI